MTTKIHSLRCKCGALQGGVETTGTSSRLVCYCSDCQAFARFLGSPDEVLNANGGTDVVQVPTHRVKLTQGQSNIAAIRLTDRGMLRWYAKCCNTPIGNTSPNHKLACIGLIHSCLAAETLETSFGQVRAQLGTASAVGGSPTRDHGLPGAIARFIAMAAAARFSGKFRRTPFFSDSGAPVVTPVVLDSEHLKRLKTAA